MNWKEKALDILEDSKEIDNWIKVRDEYKKETLQKLPLTFDLPFFWQ